MVIPVKRVAFVSTYICCKLQSENTDIFHHKEGGIFIFLSAYFVQVKIRFPSIGP